MKFERTNLVGGSLLNITIAKSDPQDLARNAIALTENGLGFKKDVFSALPVHNKVPVFRFRHVNHETEGWADIVLVQAKSSRSIRLETEYRAALQEVGFDTYFLSVDSWRNSSQDWGPSEVPAIDSGAMNFATNSAKYVLIEYPKDYVKVPTFLRRVFDSEYGQFGNGTWISLIKTNDVLSLNVSTLQQVMGDGTLMGKATYLLPENDWIMGVDPRTENR